MELIDFPDLTEKQQSELKQMIKNYFVKRLEGLKTAKIEIVKTMEEKEKEVKPKVDH